MSYCQQLLSFSLKKIEEGVNIDTDNDTQQFDIAYTSFHRKPIYFLIFPVMLAFAPFNQVLPDAEILMAGHAIAADCLYLFYAEDYQMPVLLIHL